MKFIMHKNSMDVAFEIVRTQYQDSRRLILKGYWINLGYMGYPFALTRVVTLKLKRKDYKANWKEINPIIKRIRPGISDVI